MLRVGVPGATEILQINFLRWTVMVLHLTPSAACQLHVIERQIFLSSATLDCSVILPETSWKAQAGRRREPRDGGLHGWEPNFLYKKRVFSKPTSSVFGSPRWAQISFRKLRDGRSRVEKHTVFHTSTGALLRPKHVVIYKYINSPDADRETQGRGEASQGRTLENGDHIPPEDASSGVLFRDSAPWPLSRLHDNSHVCLKAELKIPTAPLLWQNVIIKISAYEKPIPMVSKIKHFFLNDLI